MRRFILLLLAFPAPLLAQQPEIIVTGRGLAAAVGEDAYAVRTIERDRLDSSASARLEDVLRDIPGFQLFRRADSRSANPTSQGATLRALGGNASSRVLLLLDGVPQTDPFGGWIAWPAYDPRGLGAVRVTRGGGSGANGPGALAGTIELTSAAPAELSGLAVRLALGSRDARDLFASAGIPLGAGVVTLTGAHQSGDGFIPILAEDRGPVDRPAPYAQTSLSARAVTPIGETIELQASLRGFTDRRERGTAFSEIGSEGADAALRLVGTRWSAAAYVQTRDFRTRFASVDAARTTVGIAADQYAVPATGLGLRTEIRPDLGPAELRIGADWRRTEGRTMELYQFVGNAPTRSRIAGGQTDTFGVFAEAGADIGALTVTGGARIDHWAIGDGQLVERQLADGAALTDVRFADRAGWRPTARGGLAWRAGDGVTVRTAAYLGWRLPTLNELYRPFRVGPDATAANAALAPERLAGVEAGLDIAPAPGLRLGATLFASRLSDAIANVTLGQGPGTFPGVGFVAGEYRRRENIAAIESRGIEFDADYSAGPWTLAAGYAYADARIASGGPASALDGLRPAQTPRHSASATASWAQGGFAASVTARYVSAQFEDDLNRMILPGAVTFDATMRVPLGEYIAVEARAENIADRRVLAAISGNGIRERATPRTFWLSLRFTGG